MCKRRAWSVFKKRFAYPLRTCEPLFGIHQCTAITESCVLRVILGWKWRNLSSQVSEKGRICLSQVAPIKSPICFCNSSWLFWYERCGLDIIDDGISSNKDTTKPHMSSMSTKPKKRLVLGQIESALTNHHGFFIAYLKVHHWC